MTFIKSFMSVNVCFLENNSMAFRKFILPALSKIELHHQFSDEGKSCLRYKEQGLRISRWPWLH
jgi:hypothetical protein